MEDISSTILDVLDPSIPPQIDNPEHPKKAIKLARAFREQGETILKLARNRWYVDETANLLDLADDFNAIPSIQAVAVLSKGKVNGVVIRKDLFDLLGRPFGRDVLDKESVSRVARKSRVFLYTTSLVSVSEELGKVQQESDVRFYPVRSPEGEFVGIFTSQDLLNYLAEMTQKDIALARAIQGRIVKEYSVLEHSNLEIVASATMAKGVGGDFYHIQEYQPKRWLFSLCDVSGKGVAASLVTCALWGAISSFDLRRGLATLVHSLNEFIISTFQLEKYLTGVFIDYQQESRSFTIADMGHGYAFIYRNGKLMRMKTAEHSYPLGVSPNLKPELYRYSLEENDILILMTDGIIEQSGTTEGEYGIGRIKKVLETYQDESLANIRIHLLEDFHAWRGTSPLHDDITFLMVRPHRHPWHGLRNP